MFQSDIKDPAKGHMSSQPQLHIDQPQYMDIDLTRERADQIFYF